MKPQDILKTIVNVALIAAFACMTIFARVPWPFATIAIVATVCPSALPAIAAALRKAPELPAEEQAPATNPAPPPSFDTPMDRGGQDGAA